jgi:hypothetical protein
MTTAATIAAKLTLDQKDYDSGLANAEKKASDFQKKWGDAGKKMMKTGGIMTAGITAPLIGTATKFTNWASDLEESTNAVNVVFGDAANIIKDYSDQSAQMVGMSSSDFNQLSAVTGAFLKNVGFDLQGAAEETINLGERSADMASIFNTDVSQAMSAIQSGLKGEFNPLEQFGVKINAAAIEARALAMGLGDAEGNIDDNAKAQAALALIYEQTDQFAGDFRNTSDGLANSTKILKADFQNQAAAIGQQLLPIALKLVTALSGLMDKFSNLTPEQKKMILVVLGIVAAIGPLITIIGGVISVVGTLSTVFSAVAGAIGIAVGPLLLIIAAVIAVIVLLALAWKNNWGDIQGKTKAVVDWITNAFQLLKSWLDEKIPIALEWLKNAWENVLLPAIEAVYDWLNTVLFPFFVALAEFFNAVFTLALTALAGIWENVLLPAIEAVWDFIKTKLGPVIEDLVEWFNDKIMPAIKDVAGFLDEKLKKAFDGISEAIKDVTGWLKDMTDKIKNIKLPDWLTPGSPTPFEIGLRGISDAMKRLNMSDLPKLKTQLEIDSTNLVPANVTLSGDESGGNNKSIVIEQIINQIAHGADAIPYSIQRAQGYAQL